MNCSVPALASQSLPLVLRAVSKRYGSVSALQAVDLSVKRGEIFGIMGRSGAGKSSLLRLFNRLENPSSGQVLFEGEDIALLDSTRLRVLRRKVAMIFQHFNLLASRTVAENIELPLRMAGVARQVRRQRVHELLDLVGLSARRDAYPAELSGGQKQRVGIARALVLEPDILLCDEATSALDPESTQAILELLRDINQRLNLTIVLITHEMEVIRDLCHRVAVLERGQIVEEGEVWQVFGDPQHAVTRLLLAGNKTSVQAATRSDERILELHYTGFTAPDLVAISAAFGAKMRLLAATIEPIQGRTLGYVRVALSSAASAETLLACAQTLADRAAWVDA